MSKKIKIYNTVFQNFNVQLITLLKIYYFVEGILARSSIYITHMIFLFDNYYFIVIFMFFIESLNEY